jgi:pilus assembly protein Flp/PilA
MRAYLMICRFWSAIRRFSRSEDGPTAVEYAVMVSMIVSACMLAIDSVGTKATASFQKVSTTLQSSS